MVLRSVDWQLFTDVSGQHIGPIFTLEGEVVDCPETSINKYQSTLRKVPEEGRSHTAAKA